MSKLIFFVISSILIRACKPMQSLSLTYPHYKFMLEIMGGASTWRAPAAAYVGFINLYIFLNILDGRLMIARVHLNLSVLIWVSKPTTA